jgi:hydrogenase nickel incorporation protein HypA/HybF
VHEVSLALSLLEILRSYAVKDGFQHIRTVKLSMGKMSCVEPRALTFAFEIQAAGTLAEGAVLEFDIRPAILYCFSCTCEHEVDGYTAECPTCQSMNVLLTGGTEALQLLEFEAE